MNVGDEPEAAGTTGLQAIAFGLLMHASPISPQAVLTWLAEVWAGLDDWMLPVLQVASLAGGVA